MIKIKERLEQAKKAHRDKVTVKCESWIKEHIENILSVLEERANTGATECYYEEGLNLFYSEEIKEIAKILNKRIDICVYTSSKRYKHSACRLYFNWNKY